MIGLSPLSAGHRRRFQPTCVRPSTGSYPRFSLPTDSSPGFASAARDSSRPVKARFRSGSLSVNLAPRQRLAGSFYKRHAVTTESCSDCSWAHGFRYCFTPLPGCFSPFPRGTSALSVTGEYLGLEGGPPCFPPGFTCPAVLGHRQAGVALRVRGSNPLRPGFPSGSARASLCNRTVDGPTTPARLSLGPVWPLPRSLATTGGISFDFSSSGYLDVSVPRVAPSGPMCSARRRRASTARRVFPFGDPRVEGRVPLTADYRSLPRPSSASCAKASAACPYHLPSISDGMVLRLIRSLAGPWVSYCMRCDLLEENLRWSRYAALKVRPGRAPGTGHRAGRPATTSRRQGTRGMAPRPDGTARRHNKVFSGRGMSP